MNISRTIQCIVSISLVSAQLSAQSKASSLPTARTEDPCGHPDYGLYVEGAALYWKAYSEGLPYVVTGVADLPPTGGYFRNDLSVKLVPMDFRFGFALEAGYRLPETEWIVAANWLRYIGRGSQTESAPVYLTFGMPPNSTKLLLAPWNGGAMQETNFAHGRQKTYLNSYDFLLGRNVPFNNHFAVDLRAGGRIVQLNQFLHIRYEGLTTPTDTLVEFVTCKNLFHGAGMAVQSSFKYLLYYGFGLNADLGVSLLAGRFRLKWSRESIYPTGVAPTSYERQLSHENSIKSSFDIAGGAFWEETFHKDKWGVKIFANYGFSYWPSLTKLQHVRPTNDTITVLEMGVGDVSFVGTEFGADLSF